MYNGGDIYNVIVNRVKLIYNNKKKKKKNKNKNKNNKLCQEPINMSLYLH